MAREIFYSELLNDPTLKAYYRFESGALTTDSSGEAHTLSAVSDPAEDASGVFGGAVALDGNDGYTAVDHADFKPTGNFTLGGWFKTSASGDQMIIHSFNYNGTIIGGIILTLDFANLRFISYKNTGLVAGTDYQSIVSTATVNDGNWHFGVGTWDGSHLRLYLDGVSANTAVSWANAPVYQATNYVRVGMQTDDRGGSPANLSFFTGSLDDVFCINGKALSASEVFNLYQGYTASFLQMF